MIAILGPALTESFWALSDARDPLAFARRLGIADAIHTLHQGRLLLFGDDKDFLLSYSQNLTGAVLAKLA